MPPRPDDPEWILCSAIWVKDGNTYPNQYLNITTGMVLCGRRHNNIIPAVHRLFPDKSIPRVQGFVTSLGYFVGRREAEMVALMAGQITERQLQGELYSETLY